MFGRRIAEERRRLGLSQKELSELLGLGRSAIGMIETDRASIDIERLVALGTAGFDVLYILSSEPGKVAAGEFIDWQLCMAITKRVQEWSMRHELRLSNEKLALVVKHLYIELARRGTIDEAKLEETMRMAA